jgi:transcription initiation factor TFIID subunit 8
MAEEYTRRIARVAAAQMAELTGFEAAQESSIEVLAELLTKYVQEVCTAAHAHAETAHRTDFNICDLNLALSDMGTSMGDLQRYLDVWLSDQAGPAASAGRSAPIRARARKTRPLVQHTDVMPHSPCAQPSCTRHTRAAGSVFTGCGRLRPGLCAPAALGVPHPHARPLPAQL